MPRGVTPIRVRRRQSDAKWRASVAMCYNIMKCVISNHKKQGRKKLSKALTLKETERHIVSLEKRIRELIEEKAAHCGKVVMVEKEGAHLVPASFEDVKQNYALKQLAFFSSGTASTGKKRYNVPLDIESSLKTLSQQSCKLMTMSTSEIEAKFPNIYRRAKISRENIQSTSEASANLMSLLTEPLDNHDDITPFHFDLHLPVARQQKTPHKGQGHRLGQKVRRAIFQDTPKTVETRKTPKMSESKTKVHMLKTPSKVCKQLPFSTYGASYKLDTQNVAFTPIKEQANYDDDSNTSDPVMGLPGSPVMSLIGSPLGCFNIPETPGSGSFHGVEGLEFTDEDEGNNLLCTDSIESFDLEIPFVDSGIPMYEKENSLDDMRSQALSTDSSFKRDHDQEVPGSDKSCLDFDGYLMFYQHNVGSVDARQSSTDDPHTMSNIWETLSPGDKATYSQLANQSTAHKSHDLSDDLVGIDLKPLNKERGKALHTDQWVMAEDSQEVPSLSLDLSSSDLDTGLNVVPGYEDLGVFYLDMHNKQDYGPKDSDYHISTFDCSQVVPEL